MSLSTIGSRNPAFVSRSATALEIARHMDSRDVGSVIVVHERRPVGIVTDRDLVLRVVLKGLDPARTRAEQVMTRPVATISHAASIAEAAARMRESHVRRLPVVDDAGELVAVLTLDDLFFHMSRAEDDLAAVICPLPVEAGNGG